MGLDRSAELGLEETGYCWRCGRQVKQGLFCDKNHEWQYKRQQDNLIRKGKRAGYGLAGSMR